MQAVSGVEEYMGLMDEAPENKFLTKLLGLERILGRLRKLLALGSKRSGIGIPNRTETANKIDRTSLECRKRVVK